MTSTSKSLSTPLTWNGWPLWPFALFDRPAPAASAVFDQPINPGWTFGNLISVTEQNSSAPDTERDIVSVHSYGRQLGRIIDAVAVLIDDLPKEKRKSPAFRQFTELRDEIEEIKSRSAVGRLDRFAADLVELRKTDEAEYRRVAQKLRTIVGED